MTGRDLVSEAYGGFHVCPSFSFQLVFFFLRPFLFDWNDDVTTIDNQRLILCFGCWLPRVDKSQRDF